MSHSGNHTYQRTLEGVTQPPEKVWFPPAGQLAAVWTGVPSVEPCLWSRHNPTTVRIGKKCQPSAQSALCRSSACSSHWEYKHTHTNAQAHTQRRHLRWTQVMVEQQGSAHATYLMVTGTYSLACTNKTTSLKFTHQHFFLFVCGGWECVFLGVKRGNYFETIKPCVSLVS